MLSTVLESIDAPPALHSVRVTPQELQDYTSSPSALRKSFAALVPSLTQGPAKDDHALQTKKIAFWTNSDTTLSPLPEQIAQAFLGTKSIHTRLLTNADAFAKPGGIALSRLLLAPITSAPDASVNLVMPLASDSVDTDGANFTAISDASLLTTHNVLRNASPGSPILVYTSWTPTEVLTNLHPSTLSLITERDLHLYGFDAQKLAHENDDIQIALAHIAFLRLYVGDVGVEVLERVSRAVVGDVVGGVSVEKLVSSVCDQLYAVVIPAADKQGSPIIPDLISKKLADTAPLKQFEFNATSLAGFAALVAGSERNGPISGPWHEAAKHLLFPEAFAAPTSVPSDPPTINALRPELPIQTFLVTCSVNQRLTPKTYNRNVFHMEFDTTGTGLTYKLGEALGVHGWNDDGDVLEFCKWYGVDPDAIISVPVPVTQGGSGSAKDRSKVTRTVFQALQQQIDIFGRPPKSFFAALATYATSAIEKMALRFIAAPEGAATLKKLGEKDTVSYADVLALYPSARPSIEELAVIVEEIKERHYSIASAQSVVGNRVDLLVVTVDWVTPSGQSLGKVFFNSWRSYLLYSQNQVVRSTDNVHDTLLI